MAHLFRLAPGLRWAKELFLSLEPRWERGAKSARDLVCDAMRFWDEIVFLGKMEPFMSMPWWVEKASVLIMPPGKRPTVCLIWARFASATALNSGCNLAWIVGC